MKIFELDTAGNVISSFDSPSFHPTGLAWDGEHLWVSDWTENRIYQLRLATYYELSVTAENGSVSVSPENEFYPPGTQITLTATPAEGYEFAGWDGDVSGTSPSITVTMNSDKQVTANFEKTGEGGEGLPLIWIGVAAVIIIAVIVGVLLVRRRS
jgi:uncharacterized repeat protein (TIGR02543 family)